MDLADGGDNQTLKGYKLQLDFTDSGDSQTLE